MGLVLAVSASLGSMEAAQAQTPSPIVPADRPDQTPARPRTTPQDPAVAKAPDLPQVTPFVLRAVDVEGSTLPSDRLTTAWEPFLDREIGTRELASIVQDVVRRYEGSDVALYTVLVAAQTFADGRLRLRVIEGHVEGVDVGGEGPAAAKSAVARTFSPLTGVRPLPKARLQRQVSLARDLPGTRTEIGFAAGATEGGVRLTADVAARRAQVALSANNRGAAFLGRTQIAADLYLNQMLPGSQTRLTFVTPTDTERFRYFGVTQAQTLTPSGAVLQVNAGYLRTRPKGSDLKGEATSAGLQISYPLRRTFDEDLYLSLGLDGLNANSAFVGNTFSDDRTRALRVGLQYGAQTERQRWSVSGAGSLGVDALGARTLSPGVTEVSFAKVNGRVSLARGLTTRLFVRLSAVGQWSDDRLPAAEQFAFGGSEFGRGFESAAILGDKGYAATAELALRPDLNALGDFEVFGFVDQGEVVQHRRPGLARLRADLASTGLGVRGSIGDHLAFQVEATTEVDGTAPGVDPDDRLVFSLRTLW